MSFWETILKGIGVRIGLTIIIISSFVIAVTTIEGVRRVKNETTNEILDFTQNMQTVIDTALCDAMLRNDPGSIQNVLNKTGTIPQVQRISVLATTGGTYLSSDSLYVGKMQYEEEIEEIKRTGQPYLKIVQEEGLVIKAIIPIDNESGCQICHGNEPVLGYLGMNVSAEKIKEEVKMGIRRLVQRGVIQVSAVLFAITFSFLFFFQGKVNKLLSLALDFARKGDLGVKFATKGGDEIAHISRAIQRIVDYTKEMGTVSQEIAQGNLSVEVKPRSDRDIFAHSFQEMVYNLRSLVEEIRSSAARVADASKSFTSVTDQSTQTMSQLANGISQISKASTQVSQAAQTASLSAQQTLTSADSGKDALEKVVSKMSVIRSTAENMAGVIEELGERSGQVGEIVKVITRIADQTNLLSLNAAIEAARAGEAGRGFAVVADEVRKLAEDSANSAAKIANLITEIQEKTVKAVEMTMETNKEVKEGVIVTAESEKKFSEILQSAQSIANQVESIAAAAEETAASTEESSSASEEQVAGIEELSASAQNLLQTAEQLRELVTRFKV